MEQATGTTSLTVSARARKTLTDRARERADRDREYDRIIEASREAGELDPFWWRM